MMLTFVFIVANNYILVPYANLFFPSTSLELELPESLFELLKIGVGGYIFGRSGEKMVESYSKNRS